MALLDLFRHKLEPVSGLADVRLELRRHAALLVEANHDVATYIEAVKQAAEGDSEPSDA